MRAIFVAAFFLLISSTFAVSLTKPSIAKKVPVGTVKGPRIDLCPTCVNLFSNAIDELLNIILNGGVIGSCGALCQQLPEQYEAVACDLICDYIGIEEFINLVEYEDPDPIYLCQIVDLCPVVNGGAVNITSLYVDPPSGPQGTFFNITMVYTVLSPTGPGLLAVTIVPPGADFPFGGEDFQEGQPKGSYPVGWQLQATPSENESFGPGVYQVQAAVCAGDCTTSHPYGGVYAQATTSFKITG